ncbi:MAG: phosphate-starvation-inducible PsiE family protein, partial [Gemmatimonadota bacterium]
TGALLGITAVALLVLTGDTFLDAVRSGQVRSHAFEMLDSLLLILILVELVRTIRVSLVERTLAPEPFIVVALIAGVRRILFLTAETGWFIQTHPDRFRWILVEVGLFTAFILVAVGALVLLRRTPGRSRAGTGGTPEPEDGEETTG